MASTPVPVLPIQELITSPISPVSWLIPNFVPKGSIIALAGLPGAGKSYLAYTLGLALATGTSLLGWDLEPHRILYFDNENALPDCTQYLRWSWVGLDKPPIELVEENFKLAHYALGHREWGSKAQEYVLAYKPDLIVIDTASPCCAIADENDNAEATNVILQIRRIQASIFPAPAVIILKHAKVKSDDGSFTLRGAKAWEGAVDSVVYQIRQPGKPRADGLRGTHLEPSKTRAFGLREAVYIDPQWIGEKVGLKLNRIPK